MKEYQGYLVDLDGTMYKGNERIYAAKEFVEFLKGKGLPHLFLTNNSSRTQLEIAKKLNDMDIPATENHVFTSSMATASYIANLNKDGRVYVIGERGLHEALRDKGLVITDENPDFVVVGIDREITYEKLAKACLFVRNGAVFVSTNSDKAIPTERGLVPGNGALTSVITVSTGVDPVFIGKPESIIMEQALKKLGLSHDATLMVGDNYYTDITAGIRAGIDTLMVFTGVTPFEDFLTLPKKPTYHIQSLSEWIE
ncbi:TIGR01457 family HAD-type hydrolase [Virgibacillus necropolis]|uniref:TIGR01457 family HAD-type hydrolase n=1 Tax=Virgibacillus necropolis TaxID=163877 RepID=A0A221MB47_9BACI|nr:TIGR01457 family HAD-type hydrolase [Virgibacillus necropolis]ASN04875.1 TIGR01457 family HAD-type hydrolase [Virgibacillus necropolis]